MVETEQVVHQVSSGTSGTDGGDGTSGSSGSSGTSGSDGGDGTSGSSGSSGTSGSDGGDGTSGSSGTSGAAVIANLGNDRITTSTGVQGALNAEANLTFDGSKLVINGVELSGTAPFGINPGGDSFNTRITGFDGTLIQQWDDGYTYIDGGGLVVGSNTITATTDGLIKATNDIIAYASSDRRLKTNILNIPNALEKVSKLNGVTFDWLEFEENKNKEIHANEGADVGLSTRIRQAQN